MLGDYRRMRGVEQHLGNATSTTLFHQLSDLWRSPRGTVLRIEALALVAIVLSFFLAVFGSCRRWSNSWIVQKGFLAAQVLSLSLGTYSIGLMQSSSVKSEMYPIWAVSLLTLFGCIDPVTTYIGLDYMGPLLKVIFQLCLYCGYVVAISVSTNSSIVGNLAIGVLSAMTFIKGFHRSLALVLPITMRIEIEEVASTETSALARNDEGLKVHLPMLLRGILGIVDGSRQCATMGDIRRHMGELQLPKVSANGLTIEDVCLGYSLSHLLQRRFLGLSSSQEMEEKLKVFESLVRDDGGRGIDYMVFESLVRDDGGRGIDYMWTLKVIEVELAFLYEIYFSSNEFLHLYQAKTSSFWAFASFIGICFVGVAAAIPGKMASRYDRAITSSTTTNAGTIVSVDTTMADLVITFFILVSLALLQLVQLIQCWSSNWARVAFACECSRKMYPYGRLPRGSQCWMRLKAFLVTRMNWFDKYLWQDKIGQYSVVDAASSRSLCSWDCFGSLITRCLRCLFKTGAAYVVTMLWDLLGKETNRVATVGLHDDVKTSIADFLCRIKSSKIGKDWSSLFVDNGLDASYLPYKNAPLLLLGETMSDAYAFTHRVLVWHIATWYCKQAEERPERGDDGGEADSTSAKNRRVAIALSKYCAYLVVSAPELLPGPSAQTKRALGDAMMCIDRERQVQNGLQPRIDDVESTDYYLPMISNNTFMMGVYWGKRLQNETQRRSCADPWEVLARLWVQTLLYAAPYGEAQSHMQHLSRGGEFITHLWALLYHLGIDKWEQQQGTQEEAAETKEEAAGDGDTTGTQGASWGSSDITQEPAV